LNVVVIGLWHLGSVASAGWFSLGHTVFCWDPDPQRRAGLAAGVPPVIEPHLDELLSEGLDSGRIRVVERPEKAVAGANTVHLTYDSATGASGTVDDPRLNDIVPLISDCAVSGTLLLVSSQVRAGTCAAWRSRLDPDRDLSVACWPENLRLGHGVEDFLRPARLLIGADDETAVDRAVRALDGIGGKRITVGLTSAELVKHATNAYLAMCICFANELAWITRESGGDVTEVSTALRADARVAPGAPLRPGTAFSGATLHRDVATLAALGAEHGRPELFNMLLTINERHSQLVIDLLDAEFPRLSDTHVAVAGLSYKAGTSTLRDSLPLRIVRTLRSRGARVTVYDPDAEQLPGDLAGDPGLVREKALADAVAGADVVAVLTPLRELAGADWDQLQPRKRLVIDGCGALSPVRLKQMGWDHRGL
jgi:UDPglucose 6-dehydrogenase